VDWTDFLQQDVLSAPVMAAFLVLIGVFITAAVTRRIAKRNRISIEQTAYDRLEAEQRQKALDRSFSDRARTYLAARKWLRALGDLTHHSMINDIWLTDGWNEPFDEAHREEHLNAIQIYGTTNAARLFEATAEAFAESCRKKSHARSLLALRRDERQEHGAASPFAQHQDKDLQLQQSAADVAGQDYHYYGFQLLEQFTKLCQDDLADTDRTDGDLVIAPIDRSRNQQIERQRRRKFEGLPAVEEGEEELLDWGD